MLTNGILQAATTIAKTTQTLIGAQINCQGYETITLFATYTKGDETGLLIVPSFMRVSGSTAHQYGTWATAAGVNSFTAENFKMLATGNYFITLSVAGQNYIKFTQGGSNNDGTPTGTLAASYILTD